MLHTPFMGGGKSSVILSCGWGKWGLSPPNAPSLRILTLEAEILLYLVPFTYRKLRDKTAECGHFLRTICFWIIFLENIVFFWGGRGGGIVPKKWPNSTVKKNPFGKKNPMGNWALNKKTNFFYEKKKIHEIFFFFNTVNPLRKKYNKTSWAFYKKAYV